MTIHAGFATVDITPPIGTEKIGWLMRIVSTSVHDPLYARAAVFSDNGTSIGFVQLDTLCVRWTTTEAIRAGIEAATGVPAANIMVSATHNHGGPAVANVGDARRDDAYVATLVEKCVTAFTEAWTARQPAQVAFGRSTEFTVGYNRRIVMRGGGMRTHGRFSDPDALYVEGPIDPEVAVLAARSLAGEHLGMLVNFACHPAHLGGGSELSAGWPGQMALALIERGWPCPMFLNGAAGDIANQNPGDDGQLFEMTETGQRMADAAERALKDVDWLDALQLGASRTTVQLPHREPTPEQVAGTVKGAQRFIDPAIYDRGMPALCARIRRQPLQPAEVQALRMNDVTWLSIPAELFCILGLQIKEQSPGRALVVAYANGMVGYVPHAAGFARGGYETTFAGSSRLAPEAGDLLVQAAVQLAGRR